MSFLPEEDRQYLLSKDITYLEVDKDGKKGVILKGRRLPAGRYDTDTADVLVVLPSGYPDVAPDMFYLSPWVRLLPNKTLPKAADQALDFNGQNWQRWSRHNTEWRAGIDGMWAMIKRVEHALETAA